MDLNDKTLNCADCGQEFIFSRNEQAFYAERGFTNEPKRCKNCRDKRKVARDGSSGSRERQMVSVTCDSCGVATEVPFTPSLADVTALIGTDTTTPLQYSTDGTNWSTWTAGALTIPAGDAEVYFRVPSVNDTLDEAD